MLLSQYSYEILLWAHFIKYAVVTGASNVFLIEINSRSSVYLKYRFKDSLVVIIGNVFRIHSRIAPSQNCQLSECYLLLRIYAWDVPRTPTCTRSGWVQTWIRWYIYISFSLNSIHVLLFGYRLGYLSPACYCTTVCQDYKTPTAGEELGREKWTPTPANFYNLYISLAWRTFFDVWIDILFVTFEPLYYFSSVKNKSAARAGVQELFGIELSLLSWNDSYANHRVSCFMWHVGSCHGRHNTSSSPSRQGCSALDCRARVGIVAGCNTNPAALACGLQPCLYLSFFASLSRWSFHTWIFNPYPDEVTALLSWQW